MPYRARRKDNAQKQIEQALDRFGISYCDTSALGRGFPDLVVGYRGVNFLFEVKNNEKSQLTPDQQKMQEEWGGQYLVVWEIAQILEVIYGNQL